MSVTTSENSNYDSVRNIRSSIENFFDNEEITGTAWNIIKSKLGRYDAQFEVISRCTITIEEFIKKYTKRINDCVESYNGQFNPNMNLSVEIESTKKGITSCIKQKRILEAELSQAYINQKVDKVPSIVNETEIIAPTSGRNSYTIQSDIAAVTEELTKLRRYYDFLLSLNQIYTEGTKEMTDFYLKDLIVLDVLASSNYTNV